MKSLALEVIVWLSVSTLMIGACWVLPLRLENDRLRMIVMRWVLVPVSIVIIAYVYPAGIEVFRKLALQS